MSTSERLSKALAKIPDSVTEVRDALRNINDAPDLEPLLAAAVDLATIYSSEPDQGLASEFATLRGSLGQTILNPDVHNWAEDRWKALRAARGNLYADIDEVLGAAAAIGIRPDEPSLRLPDADILNRSDHERRLAALEGRLRLISEQLEQKIAPEGAPGIGRPMAQLVQVNQYVGTMRRHIRLFLLTLNVGELLDLAALERVVSTMGRLTRSFHASVVATASRASETLRNAAIAVRQPVSRLARGLRTLVRAIIRIEERAKQEPRPPRSFNMAEVEALILAGHPLPVDWRPWVKELDLSGSGITSLECLNGLVGLTTLSLAGMWIKDLTPLAELSSLQTLDISDTSVTDLSPIAGLASLETIYVGTDAARELLSRTFPRERVVKVSI